MSKADVNLIEASERMNKAKKYMQNGIITDFEYLHEMRSYFKVIDKYAKTNKKTDFQFFLLIKHAMQEYITPELGLDF